mgnify:CR=1 FL=1|tara:strand:+ start:1357 stop:1959 length:603 start_codon:yes stop_codon:yes gene_type:complete
MVGILEPVVDTEELQLAISLPDLDSVFNGRFIPLNSLTESLSQMSNFDAIFVGGISNELPVEKRRALSQICEEKGIELIEFENPSNDAVAIRDVVLNLADKLFSDEMPGNLDLADIRNINQYSDCLFAFNSQYSALCFLEQQQVGDVVGGVYLAHGDRNLREYEAINEALLKHFADDGFLCSSFHSSGRADCTILLGIRT